MGLLSACSTNETQPETTPVVTAGNDAASAAGRVPGYCGPGDWLGEKPAIADSEIKEEKKFDVVILGGGHSGLGAALGAVDEGASVAVIEQQAWGAFVDLENTGANMGGWFGEDIGHVNSQFLVNEVSVLTIPEKLLPNSVCVLTDAAIRISSVVLFRIPERCSTGTRKFTIYTKKNERRMTAKSS